MLRQYAYREIVQHGGVRLCKLHLHGQRICHLHGGDLLVVVRDGCLEVLIARQCVERELYIICGKVLAIVPFDALAQMKRVCQAVLIEIVAFGKVWHGLSLVVILHEPREYDIGQLIMRVQYRIDRCVVCAGEGQHLAIFST